MKLVKRVLGILLITVLASSLSILTTGIVVNAYIQSVLSSFDITLDSPVNGISGVMKTLTGNKDSSTEKTESHKTPVEDEVPENALPVMGEVAEEMVMTESQSVSNSGGLDQQLVMTPEAMLDLKDNLASGEKMNIFNILMTKLPQEEMQKISTAMENGLTENEAKMIQEVIFKYVNEEEYDSLMRMLTPTSSVDQ